MLLHAAEFYEAAEPAYRNAATLVPSDPRWPYYLALVARARGQLPQAVTQLTRTLDVRPADVPTLVWLGRTYLDQGQPDRAEPLLARARDAAPKARRRPRGTGAGRAGTAGFCPGSESPRRGAGGGSACRQPPGAACHRLPWSRSHRGRRGAAEALA